MLTEIWRVDFHVYIFLKLMRVVWSVIFNFKNSINELRTNFDKMLHKIATDNGSFGEKKSNATFKNKYNINFCKQVPVRCYKHFSKTVMLKRLLKKIYSNDIRISQP